MSDLFPSNVHQQFGGITNVLFVRVNDAGLEEFVSGTIELVGPEPSLMLLEKVCLSLLN